VRGTDIVGVPKLVTSVVSPTFVDIKKVVLPDILLFNAIDCDFNSNVFPLNVTVLPLLVIVKFPVCVQLLPIVIVTEPPGDLVKEIGTAHIHPPEDKLKADKPFMLTFKVPEPVTVMLELPRAIFPFTCKLLAKFKFPVYEVQVRLLHTRVVVSIVQLALAASKITSSVINGTAPAVYVGDGVELQSPVAPQIVPVLLK
jgi:hypothetical protein